MTFFVSRLEKRIQQELTKIINQNYNISQTQEYVTLTKIVVKKDLSFIEVYFSIFNKEKQKIIQKLLNKHKKKFRFLLAEKISDIRKIPKLKFFIYQTSTKAQKILDILDNLKQK